MDRIDALRLLIDVAEAGTFSSVARQRAIATSTVALAVTQLETEFGVRLMTRTTRKLVFTHEGDALLADARRIVAEWDAAIGGLREDGPLAGPIRITATNDFGRVRLRPLLDLFQARHPAVHVTLLFNDSTVDLVGEHIDLAIRSGPLPDSSLRARLLVRGPRVVSASPDYWARAGVPRRPHDLVDHNCLVLARPGAPLSTWSFDEGKNVNVKVKGDRQTSDGDVLREWASAGIGVIFKNVWDIRAEVAAGTLVTALDDFATRQVDLFAVHAGGGPPSRRLVALIDFLADALRDPPADGEPLGADPAAPHSAGDAGGSGISGTASAFGNSAARKSSSARTPGGTPTR